MSIEAAAELTAQAELTVDGVNASKLEVWEGVSKFTRSFKGVSKFVRSFEGVSKFTRSWTGTSKMR